MITAKFPFAGTIPCSVDGCPGHFEVDTMVLPDGEGVDVRVDNFRAVDEHTCQGDR